MEPTRSLSQPRSLMPVVSVSRPRFANQQGSTTVHALRPTIRPAQGKAQRRFAGGTCHAGKYLFVVARSLWGPRGAGRLGTRRPGSSGGSPRGFQPTELRGCTDFDIFGYRRQRVCFSGWDGIRYFMAWSEAAGSLASAGVLLCRVSGCGSSDASTETTAQGHNRDSCSGSRWSHARPSRPCLCTITDTRGRHHG
jgi:hypothetical protein